MRSLLMASAAVLITAGVACAQTASPTPAPTGSTGEPTATGSMTGKTAPNPADASPSVATAVPSSDTGTSTTPTSKTSTGIPGAMATKSDPAPASSSSNMASTSSEPSGMGSMGTGMTHTHHVWSGTMPADADAHTYLKIASVAIKHHNKATADEALNRAETRMLTRSVVASGPMTDDSPGVTAVENARQAVDAGNFHEAAMETDIALHRHTSGMSGPGQMSDTSSTNDQSSGGAMPGQGSASPGMSAGAASGAQQ